MAYQATANPLISRSMVSSSLASREDKAAVGGKELRGRRSCFVSISAVAVAALLPDSIDSRKALLQEYLERSKQNKAKYDKERLDDYYKRNYKDYFESVEGSLQGKKDELLTQSEKGIREWLLKNK